VLNIAKIGGTPGPLTAGSVILPIISESQREIDLSSPSMVAERASLFSATNFSYGLKASKFRFLILEGFVSRSFENDSSACFPPYFSILSGESFNISI
jgi:hypothetical protein